jgi:hypothetical protein
VIEVPKMVFINLFSVCISDTKTLLVVGFRRGPSCLRRKFVLIAMIIRN